MTLEGLLQVSTKKGAYYVGAQQDVYVHAGFSKETGKDLTLRKKGGDLNIGDLVLLHAQSLDVPFHEVKKDLDALSPPYHRARHTVMTVVGEGKQTQEIPQLRQLLLRGLAPATDIPYDEQKALLREGADYDASAYSRFAAALKDILPDVPSSRLLSWLHGNVLAPRDWETFNQLRTLDARFGEIYDTMQQEDGFFARYKLYVGANQVVMRSLGGFADDSPTADDGNGEQQPRTRKPSRHYEPQIRAIFERYGHLLEDDVLAMRVMRIQEVEQQKKKDKAKAPATVLSRGVVSEWTPNPEGISYQELCHQKAHLDFCFTSGVLKYLLVNGSDSTYNEGHMLNLDPYSVAFFMFVRDHLLGRIDADILREIDEKYYKKEGIALLTMLPPEDYQGSKELALQFLTRYREGSLDTLLSLPCRTWDSTINAMQKIRTLVPRAFYEIGKLRPLKDQLSNYLSAATDLQREDRRKAVSVHKKVVDKIKKLEEYLWKFYEVSDIIDARNQARLFLGDLVVQLYRKGTLNLCKDKRSVYLEAKKFAESGRLNIMTRDEALQLFEKAGTPLAIHLLDDLNWI